MRLFPFACETFFEMKQLKKWKTITNINERHYLFHWIYILLNKFFSLHSSCLFIVLRFIRHFLLCFDIMNQKKKRRSPKKSYGKIIEKALDFDAFLVISDYVDTIRFLFHLNFALHLLFSLQSHISGFNHLYRWCSYIWLWLKINYGISTICFRMKN